ncbi:unnamed protein product [Urochloa humidicola]
MASWISAPMREKTLVVALEMMQAERASPGAARVEEASSSSDSAAAAWYRRCADTVERHQHSLVLFNYQVGNFAESLKPIGHLSNEPADCMCHIFRV